MGRRRRLTDRLRSIALPLRSSSIRSNGGAGFIAAIDTSDRLARRGEPPPVASLT